jgi:hypothetical protein
MAFTSQIFKTTADLTLVCAGVMDEHMQLPAINEGLPIRVDLQQVTYINSIGVRKWIRWVSDMTQKPLLLMENCPAIFVKNLATIKGMMADNMSVESFYVPYYNDETGQRRNVLFRTGIEFFPNGQIHPPEIHEEGVGKFEIDVVEDIYFSFLKIR